MQASQASGNGGTDLDTLSEALFRQLAAGGSIAPAAVAAAARPLQQQQRPGASAPAAANQGGLQDGCARSPAQVPAAVGSPSDSRCAAHFWRSAV